MPAQYDGLRDQRGAMSSCYRVVAASETGKWRLTIRCQAQSPAAFGRGVDSQMPVHE
jgi:hypothetical protein